ncbi:hypothetical protein DFP73DRAFT_586938 [Morchella snyderi]|nr:hypothetical protein DFP73DRAFT_586938 [Morchella snyderi]
MFEKQALKQYDHSLDQESWPLLELTDACVYRYRRSEKDIMADLLDVQDTGPYRIRGRLSPVPAEYADIVYPGKAARLYSEELTIAGVTTYSIQSLADGTFTLWALGQCGWYSLQPSRRYAPIFAGAVEKMQLWAFLQDRYLDSYEGAGPPIPGTIAEVYADYSRLRRESCPSAKTAKRLFDQHHRFLLFEMCAAWTDTPMWARTPLFRDWKVAYKREVEGVVKMAAAGSLEDRIKAGVVKREVKEEEEEEGEEGREVPPPPPPPPQPKKQGGSGKALAKKVPAKKGPAKKLVQQKLHPIFVKKETAAEPDHIIIFDTEDEADAAADSEDEGDDEDDDDEEEEEEEEDDDDDDDEEDGEDVQPSSSSARRSRGRPKATPRPTHSSKGKSILRPVRTSAPAPDYSHGFTDSDSDPAPRSPTKRTITTTTTTKRSADPARSSSTTTTTASKRACTATARTAASTPTSTTTSTTSTSTTSRPSLIATLRIGAPTSTTTSATATAAAAAAAAARIKTTTTTTTTTFISSAASPLASIAPKAVGSNRPGGLWECEIAGCRHFVLDADRAESLAAVEAHYEEHGRVMRLAMEAIGGEVVEVERERGRGRGGVLAGAGAKRVDLGLGRYM